LAATAAIYPCIPIKGVVDMKQSKDQKSILLEKTAREFARKTLMPDIHATDRFPHGPFFRDALKIAYDSEFLHIALPEALNGMDRKLKPLCILLQNISEVDASMGGIILAASQELMLAGGAESILAEIVSQNMEPKDFMIAFPLFTHPDEKALDVTAQSYNGSYQLTGTAEYMVLGSMAGNCLVPAKTSRGYSYFLVNSKAEGVVASEPVKSLGLHACHAVDLTLSKVEGILIGEEDDGALLFSKTQEKMMIAAASVALGLMKSSYKDARQYASKRLQGGRKIIEWSEVSGMLGQMAIKTRIADMLLYKTIEDADAGISGWAEEGYAAASTILADACTVSTLGVQVFGGYGYMKDFPQEKRFRDTRHLQSVFGAPGRRAINFIKQYQKVN
jgi:alkylation response protein AidB-like acyl-CoA dehydrogenase